MEEKKLSWSCNVAFDIQISTKTNKTFPLENFIVLIKKVPVVILKSLVHDCRSIHMSTIEKINLTITSSTKNESWTSNFHENTLNPFQQPCRGLRGKGLPVDNPMSPVRSCGRDSTFIYPRSYSVHTYSKQCCHLAYSVSCHVNPYFYDIHRII